MKIEGELVEIGRLGGEGDVDGLVVRRPNGSLVTITGLERDEVRVLASHWMDRVTVTVAAA